MSYKDRVISAPDVVVYPPPPGEEVNQEPEELELAGYLWAIGASEDDEPATVEQARRRALVQIMGKVQRGEKLTADQRQFLALNSRADEEVDALASEELEGWRRVADPLTEPVLAAIEASTSYDDLVQRLANLQLDTKQLEAALAVLTFKARGLGDAKDQPK